MPQAIHPTRLQPVCSDCIHSHGTRVVTLCLHPSAPIDVVDGKGTRFCNDHRQDRPPVAGEPPRCGPAAIYFAAKSDRPAP